MIGVRHYSAASSDYACLAISHSDLAHDRSHSDATFQSMRRSAATIGPHFRHWCACG